MGRRPTPMGPLRGAYRDGRVRPNELSASAIPAYLAEVTAFLREEEVQKYLASATLDVSNAVLERAKDFYIVLNETCKAEVSANGTDPKHFWLGPINRCLEALMFLGASEQGMAFQRSTILTADTIDPEPYQVSCTIGDVRVRLAFLIRTETFRQEHECRISGDGELRTHLAPEHASRLTIVDGVHLVTEQVRGYPAEWQQRPWADGFTQQERQAFYATQSLGSGNRVDRVALGEAWRKAQSSQEVTAVAHRLIQTRRASEQHVDGLAGGIQKLVSHITWHTEIGNREMKTRVRRPSLGHNYRYALPGTQGPIGLPSIPESDQLQFGDDLSKGWDRERILKHLQETKFLPSIVDLMKKRPKTM